MKNICKTLVSAFLTTSLIFSNVGVTSLLADVTDSVSAYAGGVNITSSGPWVESGYVMWDALSNAQSYNVYYKRSVEPNFTKADAQLIRGTKVDLVGLMGGREYEVKVVPVIGGAEEESLSATTKFTPYVVQETGFAFADGHYTTGGYNKDGSIPENADIVYVTNDTFSEFSSMIKTRQNSKDDSVSFKPLIARVIGTIKGSDMFQIKYQGNLTIEGVGDDAIIEGMGIDVTYECKNVEIRNLTFQNYSDDGFQINLKTQDVFVHNNTFKAGYDGACDIKNGSDYVTVAYNHVDGADKAWLCGHSNSNAYRDEGFLHVSYHHNWFDKSVQRNPRVRFGDVHVYNNYYDGITSYCIGSACEAQVLVEGNYFYNSKRPYIVSKQGNAIKPEGGDYKGNLLTNSPAGYLKAQYNYIDSTCTYNDDTVDTKTDGWNFNPTDFYDVKLEKPEVAKTEALALAGVVRYGEPVYEQETIKDSYVETTTSDNTTPVQKNKVWNVGSMSSLSSSSSSERVVDGLAIGPNVNKSQASAITSYDGVSLSNYLNLKSGGDITDKYLKFTTTAPVTLKVYADGKGLYLSDGTNKVSDINTEKTNSKITPVETYLGTAGTYYLLSESNTVKIYRIELIPDANAPVPETTTQTTTNETTTQTTTRETPTETTTKETPTETTTQDTDVMMGDVNLDGTLTASDAANVLSAVLNSDEFGLTDVQKKVSDVSKDGSITASDAATILSKVLNNDFVF